MTMKNLIRLLLLAVSFTALSGAASAQNDKQRLSREQLAEAQARHIAGEMAMDSATSKRFIAASKRKYGRSAPAKGCNPIR